MNDLNSSCSLLPMYYSNPRYPGIRNTANIPSNGQGENGLPNKMPPNITVSNEDLDTYAQMTSDRYPPSSVPMSIPMRVEGMEVLNPISPNPFKQVITLLLGALLVYLVWAAFTCGARSGAPPAEAAAAAASQTAGLPQMSQFQAALRRMGN